MTDQDLSPTGRAKGGLARKEALSPERRSEIARMAAQARYGAKPLHATHKGSFKADFGLDVECFVLDDPNKTAVISQRGMGEALNLGDGGSRLPRFVGGKKMAQYVGAELRAKLENPLVFQPPSLGHNSPPRQLHGYDVADLIDLCKVIVKAQHEGSLLGSQANIAAQAQVILNASAKSGIKGLVYALAGYNPTTQEVIQAFRLYVQEEAKKYEQEFPPELYAQWQRLYNIPLPERGKPWQFMHLTRRHIYFPLAQSNGKIYDLVKALKAKDGDQKKKLFQFLNDVGARALRMQIGRVLEMAEDAEEKSQYEAKIVKRFGGQQELELVIPPPAA